MINTVGILVLLIVIVGLIYFLKTRVLDSFIVFLDDMVIPTTCYNYLVSNGKDFFLFNTKKQIDGITNPMKFNTKESAQAFLKNNKCPVNIPFVDMNQRKNPEDPTVSFQRECNRKVAPNLFDLDICGTYGSDQDTLTNKFLARVNKIESDRSQYSNYDQESCMINKASTENPELDDSNFKDYFAQYFDRLNSNIDEEYLYITGR
jgi:hypothetical protein